MIYNDWMSPSTPKSTYMLLQGSVDVFQLQNNTTDVRRSLRKGSKMTQTSINFYREPTKLNLQAALTNYDHGKIENILQQNITDSNLKIAVNRDYKGTIREDSIDIVDVEENNKLFEDIGEGGLGGWGVGGGVDDTDSLGSCEDYGELSIEDDELGGGVGGVKGGVKGGVGVGGLGWEGGRRGGEEGVDGICEVDSGEEGSEGGDYVEGLELEDGNEKSPDRRRRSQSEANERGGLNSESNTIRSKSAQGKKRVIAPPRHTMRRTCHLEYVLEDFDQCKFTKLRSRYRGCIIPDIIDSKNPKSVYTMTRAGRNGAIV